MLILVVLKMRELGVDLFAAPGLQTTRSLLTRIRDLNNQGKTSKPAETLTSRNLTRKVRGCKTREKV
jgi:hypothetical protein